MNKNWTILGAFVLLAMLGCTATGVSLPAVTEAPTGKHETGRIVWRDLPPLLGGYPTSLWRPGEIVADRVLLSLPDDQPMGGDCELEIVLYDRMTLKAVGTARLEGFRPT